MLSVTHSVENKAPVFNAYRFNSVSKIETKLTRNSLCKKEYHLLG